MVKLLIIADDFTGALDTGVQFAACGAATRVVTNHQYDFNSIDESAQVLVMDAETRHLGVEDAYRVVYRITKRACEAGVPYLYKKTDSALRGNIGSELTAVLEAAGCDILHFLPAFPKMDRITMQGIHYIGEILVHESVFGRDPYEPVICSFIPEIIKVQSDIKVMVVSRGEIPVHTDEPMIRIYDAVDDEDIRKTALQLKDHGGLHVMAGCAGFAAVLPGILGLGGAVFGIPKFKEHFLVACGSVNPITKQQLDYAEHHGFRRIRLTAEQKLKAGYLKSEAGRRDIEQWKEICQGEKRCVIDTNDAAEQDETTEYAIRNHISTEELRARIAENLGYIIKELILAGVDSTVLITGGDSLMGFMKQVGVHEITPICEIAPGTVLSEFKVGERSFEVISKSGGFGEKSLMVDLAELVLEDKKEKIIC